MSFRGQLRRLGIDTDGKDVEIFDGDLTLKTDHKLYFRDSGCYIYSNADGYLTIEADTGLVIAADLAYTGTLAFTTTDDTAITVAATGTALTGTLRSINITHTQTGASYVTKLEVIKAAIASSVMTGDWANAIVGVITYTAPGTSGGGMAAAICAEMNLPAQSMGGGTYANIHTYLGVPNNCVLEDSQTHVVTHLRLEAGGTDVSEFDDHGYLMHVVGLTAASAGLLGTSSNSLKILVGTTERFLALGNAEGNLTFANTAVTAINVSGVCTGNASDGLTGSAILQHGSYSNAVAHGTISVTHLVLQSIHISVGATGKYVFGNLCRIDTSAISTGHMIGHYGYIYHGAYNCGDSYAVRGRMDVTGSAALGLANALMGEVNVTGGTITGSSGASINGLHVDVNVTAGATVAQEIHGILIDTSGIAVNCAGVMSALKIAHAGGSNYLDYGIYLSNCFHNATAAIFIEATQGNLACGVLFASGSHTTTNIITVTGLATNLVKLPDDEVFGSDNATSPLSDIQGTASTGFIRVEIGSSTRYIALYSAN